MSASGRFSASAPENAGERIGQKNTVDFEGVQSQFYFGDLDSDGDVDIATTSRTRLELGSARGLTAGDVDGDGGIDIVVAGYRTVEVHWHEGDSFTEPDVLGEVESARGLVVRDLDGDGRPEIAVGDEDLNGVTVYSSLEGRRFAAPRSFAECHGLREPRRAAVRRAATFRASGHGRHRRRGGLRSRRRRRSGHRQPGAARHPDAVEPRRRDDQRSQPQHRGPHQ